ncbi:MAG: hypothetical protein JNJ54_37495 [Myxococcaceae bacterium]|nr:hypothetical protein [Myxococcaceae bacterium]
MTDSTKFVQWLGDKVQAALSEAKRSGDPLEAWRVLDEVQRAFDGGAGMLFGAVISSHLPALQRELGPWVKQELSRLGAELEAGVLAPLGHVTTQPARPPGLFSKLGALFSPSPKPPPPSGVRDEQAAFSFAERAGLALAHLLEHQDPTVRRVMARALASRDAVPRLTAQLDREGDLETARALVTQLNRQAAELTIDRARGGPALPRPAAAAARRPARQLA